MEASSANNQRRYPTLYLLHGIGDDYTTWQRLTGIERYVESRNLAVVMPAAQRSYYTNTTDGRCYWTFISEEVPFLARSFFPLSDIREENFSAGLSMGGYGAFKLALTHLDGYTAAASLSGTLGVVHRMSTAGETESVELKHIFGEASALAGSPNDLFYLAERVAEGGRQQPELYQWCGTKDFLYQDNIRFQRHASTRGLKLTYEEGPGTHE